MKLSAIFLAGTTTTNNSQGLPLVVIVFDSRRWRADVEWFTLRRGFAETWNRDRMYVLAGRMFHALTAGLAGPTKMNVAEVLESLQHPTC